MASPGISCHSKVGARLSKTTTSLRLRISHSTLDGASWKATSLHPETAHRSKRAGSLNFIPEILKTTNQSQTGSQSLSEGLENEKNAKQFIDDLLQEIEKSTNEQEGEKKDTPLIAVMKGSYRRLRPKKKREELLAVLIYYSIEDVIDQQSCGGGQTALHLAVAQGDFSSAVVLVAFGANVNVIDNRGCTPLDLIMTNPKELEATICIPYTSGNNLLHPQQSPGSKMLYEEREKMVELLTSTGAVRGEAVEKLTKVEEVVPFPCVPSWADESPQSEETWLTWECKLTSLYSSLREETERLLHLEEPTIEQLSQLGVHQRKLCSLKKAGSRVLFLDGGGIRGLMQIEALSQLERNTGRKITELFDWIVGTSTGGIVALALVYGKKTLPQLRQLYFKLKDEVFGKVRAGVATEVRKFEEILRKEFSTEDGEELHMDHVTYPRVMIAAVDKSYTTLKLQFFNNCFNDNYHKCEGKPWPVWKVARYTSAAPLLFGECDNFVDGGVLANNPSESGLTRIEQFYRDSKKSILKLPISLVVSVGSGLIPEEELGNTNAQEILFFGAKGWIDSTAHVKERATNFKTLLLNAISDTEAAVENCRSRCAEQGIPFFRINPSLEKAVSSQENNSDVLVDMMLKATKNINHLKEVKDLIRCFHVLSNVSNKVYAQLLEIQNH